MNDRVTILKQQLDYELAQAQDEIDRLLLLLRQSRPAVAHYAELERHSSDVPSVIGSDFSWSYLLGHIDTAINDEWK